MSIPGPYPCLEHELHVGVKGRVRVRVRVGFDTMIAINTNKQVLPCP